MINYNRVTVKLINCRVTLLLVEGVLKQFLFSVEDVLKHLIFSVWVRYEKGTEKIAAIDEIIIHPKYNWKENLNRDIALLHMKKPITFTNEIHPVCLPSKAISKKFENTILNNPVTFWSKLFYVFVHFIYEWPSDTFVYKSTCISFIRTYRLHILYTPFLIICWK